MAYACSCVDVCLWHISTYWLLQNTQSVHQIHDFLRSRDYSAWNGASSFIVKWDKNDKVREEKLWQQSNIWKFGQSNTPYDFKFTCMQVNISCDNLHVAFLFLNDFQLKACNRGLIMYDNSLQLMVWAWNQFLINSAKMHTYTVYRRFPHCSQLYQRKLEPL